MALSQIILGLKKFNIPIPNARLFALQIILAFGHEKNK
jgi:hypothetical protein